jgi:hypothetical protein
MSGAIPLLYAFMARTGLNNFNCVGRTLLPGGCQMNWIFFVKEVNGIEAVLFFFFFCYGEVGRQ